MAVPCRIHLEHKLEEVLDSSKPYVDRKDVPVDSLSKTDIYIRIA